MVDTTLKWDYQVIFNYSKNVCNKSSGLKNEEEKNISVNIDSEKFQVKEIQPNYNNLGKSQQACSTACWKIF